MNRHFLYLGVLVVIADTTPINAQIQPGYMPLETYPAGALRLRQEGRVVTHLVIATDGSVEACTVKTSSGFPALDAGACDIARKKIHYKTPARDAAGQLVESALDLSMRFKLPSTPPPESSPDSKIQN